MSAECWMFEVQQPLPFWPDRFITIDVRYVGPDWDWPYDSPSVYLNEIKEHLEIYAIYGIEDYHDSDAGITDFYVSLKSWLSTRNDQLLTLVIKHFDDTETKPEWYWDT